ncbi:MAG: bifunctional adenosylcobinamide kinase/adenosylcobinamide-phosphate guanylyltransferase [Hyphomicrobium sp.]
MSSSISPRLTLVLGGARSGKSALAESLLAASPGPMTYIATAEARDDEMRVRIDAHRTRRGRDWTTVEAPVALVAALNAAEGPALIDCLTLWLTNLMLGSHAIAPETDKLIAALQARAAPCILVSNEVGLGIVPENALARAFRDEAGCLNQRVAAACDRVLFVAAGLPVVLKGPSY